MPHDAVQGRVRGSRSCRDFKSRRKKFELLDPSPWPEESSEEIPEIGKLQTRTEAEHQVGVAYYQESIIWPLRGPKSCPYGDTKEVCPRNHGK